MFVERVFIVLTSPSTWHIMCPVLILTDIVMDWLKHSADCMSCLESSESVRILPA